jgi:hypothetical protein
MTHLILANNSWNLKIENYVFNLKKIQVPQFFNMIFFLMWMVGYHHFNFFSHQFFFIKRILSLECYKTDSLVLEFKSLLLKLKLNWLN